MLLNELFARAPLYRGYSFSNIKLAVDCLKTNSMKGYTKQRWWPEGKRYTDDQPEYQTSYWLKGVSLTRDVQYARQWGSIVFILDQDLLRQKYKTIPFHWGSTIRGNPSPKREREELLILDKSPDSFFLDDSDEGDYPGKRKRLDVQRFNEPSGQVSPLNKYLIGFQIEKESYETFGTVEQYRDDWNYLIQHPKFLGFY